jgi:predicted cobalt transporter CbtA
MSFGCLLRRLTAAGAVAGAAAALVSLLLVQPVIRAALALEAARSNVGIERHEEVFTRPVQVLGGMVAAVVVGIAFGVVFAVVFAMLRHRLPAGTDFGRALLLAVAGFVVFSLLPALKYPANPPGVGDPETITERTWAYAGLIAAGVLVVVGAALLHGKLARWAAQPVRVTVVTAAGVTAFALLLWLFPATPDAVPADVPASLLWQFRLASLAELVTLWGVLGFSAGLLLDSPRHATRARPSW